MLLASREGVTIAMDNDVIIDIQGIEKSYDLGTVTVRALWDVDLKVEQGSYLAIMGPSGSGKSTLLNILGCLDPPTAGTYRLDERDVSKLDDDELSAIRGRYLGFIFQSYNLIAQLTVIENIQVPLVYQGKDLQEHCCRCVELAELVGDCVHEPITAFSAGKVLSWRQKNCPFPAKTSSKTGETQEIHG